MTTIERLARMQHEQKERERIVAWLRAEPFPCLERKATFLERLKSAWVVLVDGERALKVFCLLIAFKIEGGAHLKGPDQETSHD
jgi:hypothetical protein